MKKKKTPNLIETFEKNIYLSFTRKCNFACSYCYCRDSLDDQATPSFARIDKLINFVQYIPGLKSITLVGGEPLIDKKRVFYFLDKIKKINLKRKTPIKIGIITNGTCYVNLKPYLSFVRNIQISLNGFREQHNVYRKYKKDGKGSFDNVIKNYYKYYLDGIRPSFHCVVDEKTIDSIVPSVETLIQRVNLFGQRFNIQIAHRSPWEKNILKLIKLHVDLYRLNKKRKQVIVLPHGSGAGSVTSVCRAGASLLGIDLVSGQVHACHENNGSKQDIVGSMEKGIKDKIINKNFKELDVKLYRYACLPKSLSQILFNMFPVSICPVRNEFYTKNKFIVPWYQFLIMVMGVVLKKVLRKYEKKPEKQPA